MLERPVEKPTVERLDSTVASHGLTRWTHDLSHASLVDNERVSQRSTRSR